MRREPSIPYETRAHRGLLATHVVPNDDPRASATTGTPLSTYGHLPNFDAPAPRRPGGPTPSSSSPRLPG
jgi:hypothetical protein